MYKSFDKTKSPKKFDRRSDGYETPGVGGRQTGRVFKKKVCRFCSNKAPLMDFKDVEFLQKFLTEKGKIIPRRITGNCAKHQRQMTVVIKRSRHSGLIGFQVE